MGCVYLVTNVVNGKCYVGKTLYRLNFRMRSHKYEAFDNLVAATVPFHNALRKYGFDAFRWEYLFRGNNNEKLLEREIYYIKLLNTQVPGGYNVTVGGEGVVGYRATAETRAKLAVVCRGWKHTTEARAKIGAAFVGRIFSDEHLAKISMALKGRKYSPETISKMSAAAKRRKRSPLTPETRAKISAALKNRTKIHNNSGLSLFN